MKPLRALLVDDDRIARLSLRSLLEPQLDLEVIGEAASAAEAVALAETLKPDVLFLDIEMPDASGLDLVERISRPVRTVFVTSHNEYALRAFEVNALDYLLKPVSAERLLKTIKRLREAGNERETGPLRESDLVYLPLTGGQLFLPVLQLVLVESKRNNTVVWTSDGRKFVVRRSLNQWQNVLPAAHFLRLNRQILIGLSAVAELSKTNVSEIFLRLSGKDRSYRVSRRRYAEIRRALQERERSSISTS